MKIKFYVIIVLIMTLLFQLSIVAYDFMFNKPQLFEMPDSKILDFEIPKSLNIITIEVKFQKDKNSEFVSAVTYYSQDSQIISEFSTTDSISVHYFKHP